MNSSFRKGYYDAMHNRTQKRYNKSYGKGVDCYYSCKSRMIPRYKMIEITNLVTEYFAKEAPRYLAAVDIKIPRYVLLGIIQREKLYRQFQ